jgi:hypothetical protein
MARIKRVDAWETTDGRTWPSEQEAQAHQAELELRSSLQADCTTDIETSEVFDVLCQRPAHYAELLTAIAAMTRCEKCGGEAGSLRPCPYDQDVGNGNKVCNCCTACREECARDI